MSGRRALAVPAVVVAILMAAPAPRRAMGQSNFGAREPSVRVEWEAGTLRGRAGLWGHVVNGTSTAIADVYLLIETLDAAGKPVARQHLRLAGELDTAGRGYFEAALQTPGPAYRVRVEAFSSTRGGD